MNTCRQGKEADTIRTENMYGILCIWRQLIFPDLLNHKLFLPILHRVDYNITVYITGTCTKCVHYPNMKFLNLFQSRRHCMTNFSATIQTKHWKSHLFIYKLYYLWQWWASSVELIMDSHAKIDCDNASVRISAEPSDVRDIIIVIET